MSDLMVNHSIMQAISAPRMKIKKSAVAESAGAGSPDTERKRLEMKKACAEFESLFLYYMLKEMRSTVPKSGLISGGKSEEMYTSMLDQHLAQEISRERSLGLATLFETKLTGADKTAPDEHPE